MPDHPCVISFLLVFIWKRKQFENQGFSLALEAQGARPTFKYSVGLKLCRTQLLHSSCCQEIDIHEKRDEQKQITLGALPAESLPSVLGFACGDLDPGRHIVSFSICGDKEQGFSQHGLLSRPAVAPVDSSSF